MTAIPKGPTKTAQSIHEPDHSARAEFARRFGEIREHLEQLAGRKRMGREEREEFVAWALLRMVESDYNVVTSWRAESSWSAYLRVVGQRLLLDYRNHRWGKWRLSAVARRGSRAAQLLDILIHRDGFPVQEAVEFVLRNHRTGLDRFQLHELAADLPARQERRTADLDAVPEPAARHGADRSILDDERHDLCAQVRKALGRSMEGLDPADLRLLEMRFCGSAEAAEIARVLRIPRRRVYQRIETALARLRRALSAHGVGALEAQAVVGHHDTDLRVDVFRCGDAPERITPATAG